MSRVWAMAATALSGKHASASQTFKRLVPQHSIIDVPHYIRHWWQSFAAYGHVLGKPKSGRPHAMSRTSVKLLYELLSQGILKRSGKRIMFKSIPHALAHPAVKRVLHKLKVHPRTVSRSLKALGYDLIHTTRRVLKVCTPEQRVARSSMAAQLLAASPASLHNTVWVDEGSVHISFTSQHVIGSKAHGEYTVEVPDPIPKFHGAPIKLKFLLMINSHMGLVKLVRLTGCSGYQRARPYQVRPTRTCECTVNVGCTIRHTLHAPST